MKSGLRVNITNVLKELQYEKMGCQAGHTNWQKDGRADGQADRQTDRKAEKQKEVDGRTNNETLQKM